MGWTLASWNYGASMGELDIWLGITLVLETYSIPWIYLGLFFIIRTYQKNLFTARHACGKLDV